MRFVPGISRAPQVATATYRSHEGQARPTYRHVEYREPQIFRHGEIRATVPSDVLTRDQLLVLCLIADSFPARLVYFSLGNYPQALGLGEHLATHGLAQRRLDAPARTLPTVVALGGGSVDVARTRALWDSYRGPAALLAERDWVDDASAMIPTAYVVTGQTLAQALALRGDAAGAHAVFSSATVIARKLCRVPWSSQ